MSFTCSTELPLKSALAPLQGAPGWPVHPANHALRKAKMSCTVAPPVPLKFAGQQVV